MVAFCFCANRDRKGDMELTVSKRVLFAGLAALLTLGGAAILATRIKINPPRVDRTAPHASPTAVPSQPPPDLLTDDAAGEVVRETVVAYFSIDPADEVGWVQAITRVAADQETVGMLESSLWPEMSKANVRSRPSHVAVSQVITGYDTTAHRRWEVWRSAGLRTFFLAHAAPRSDWTLCHPLVNGKRDIAVCNRLRTGRPMEVRPVPG